jgi:hypothetical protein
MKRIIIFFLLVLSGPSFSQVRTPYFLYEKNKIQLADRNFKKYIIPQLRAIKQEYFLLLRKLHPLHDNTIKLYTQLSSTERTFSNFSSECSQITAECLTSLKGLYLQTRKLDNLISRMQTKEVNLKKAAGLHQTEALLQLISSLGQMGNNNYRLMHALEEYILTSNTSFFPYYDGKTLIEPTIHEMLLSSELLLNQLLTGELKEDFHAVWMHFFRSIDERIIYKKNKVFLLKRLEGLNLAWNTFHMKMTKGNHNLPKNLVSLIKIMHNRWNSCLKIILR